MQQSRVGEAKIRRHSTELIADVLPAGVRLLGIVMIAAGLALDRLGLSDPSAFGDDQALLASAGCLVFLIALLFRKDRNLRSLGVPIPTPSHVDVPTSGAVPASQYYRETVLSYLTFLLFGSVFAFSVALAVVGIVLIVITQAGSWLGIGRRLAFGDNQALVVGSMLVLLLGALVLRRDRNLPFSDLVLKEGGFPDSSADSPVLARYSRETVLVFAAFLAFSGVVVFDVMGHTSRLTQGWHGLHHTAYIYQIVNGILPPSNPLSLGMPATDYWGWHLLIAIIVKTLDITPLEAGLIANSLALAITLTAVWVATAPYTRNRWFRLTIALLPFVILNPFGLAKFFYRLWYWLQQQALPLPEASTKYLVPGGGAFGFFFDSRAGPLFSKFLDFTAFPTAVALFAVMLVVLVLPGLRLRTRCIASGLTAALIAFFHPTTGLAVVVVASASVLVHVDEYRRTHRRDVHLLAQNLAPSLAIGIGLLVAGPYLWQVSRAFGSSVSLSLTPAQLLANGILTGWTLVPAVPIYVLGFIQFSNLPIAGRFYWLTGALLGLGTILLSLPDANQYKFALLFSIPSSLVVLVLARRFAQRVDAESVRWRRICSTATATLLGCGVLAVAASLTIYAASAWAREDPYVYRGQVIDLAPSSGDTEREDLRQAYAWLRGHTPATAFVLEAPVGQDELELPAVAQRRTVVALPSMYTQTVPYQAVLVDESRGLMSELGACAVKSEDLDRLFSIPAPWPNELYALARKSDGFGSTEDCASQLPSTVSISYSNAHFAVFRVRNPSVA